MADARVDGPVLVTGAAGFVGAAIAERLAAAHVEVHAVVHPRTDAWRMSSFAGTVTVHRCDVADLGATTDVVRRCRPRAVVHAAARAGHPSTPAQRLAAWTDNVIATVALVEALASAPPARLLHLGSSLEYRASDLPLTENDPLEPSTSRGASKAASSIAALQRGEELGVAVAVLRPFSVYGPREPRARIVPTVLTCLRSGEPLRLTRDDPRRDFVHIDDVVDACVRTMSCATPVRGALNVGTGVETSTRQLLAVAEQVTGRTVTVDEEPYPPTAPDRRHWVASTDRTAEVLGWRATIDLAEGLRRTWVAP